MKNTVLQIVFDNTDGVTVAKLWRTANFGFIDLRQARTLRYGHYPRHIYERIKSAKFEYMGFCDYEGGSPKPR